MFELIGSVVEEANMDNGAGMDSSHVRGVGRGFWQELKRKYDPEGVFDLAVTRLNED
jgi:hypothetical protein